jgi:hypothetical protein
MIPDVKTVTKCESEKTRLRPLHCDFKGNSSVSILIITVQLIVVADLQFAANHQGQPIIVETNWQVKVEPLETTCPSKVKFSLSRKWDLIIYDDQRQTSFINARSNFRALLTTFDQCFLTPLIQEVSVDCL